MDGHVGQGMACDKWVPVMPFTRRMMPTGDAAKLDGKFFAVKEEPPKVSDEVTRK